MSSRKCDTCKKKGASTAAVLFCKQCSVHLCEHCKSKHVGWLSQALGLARLKHTFVPIEEHISHEAQVSSDADEQDAVKVDKQDAKQDDVPVHNPHGRLKREPGKPQSVETTAESVLLAWVKPTDKRAGDLYQVRYIEVSKERKPRWATFQVMFNTECGKIDGLKSKTTYQFVVRVVDEEGEEGPKSEPSDIIKTFESLGTRLIRHSKVLEQMKDHPTTYLPAVQEIKEARNIKTKVRKFEIGKRDKLISEEKTILVVGETGCGKSTLIDGMSNYIFGVNFNDPFRFKIVTLEAEEKERLGNQALSQTDWISCYTIHPQNGSRLKYTLNIIDSPGFGDTRGLEQDQKIVDQMRELFTHDEPKGVQNIDAVCFVVKASDLRLTSIQTYIFESIMSLFGNNIEENICTMITFADGTKPMVCASLKESKLPFGEYFTFNNSAWFAANENTDPNDMSLSLWNMGMKSFKEFFNQTETFKTESLQLTGEVLIERYRLQMTLKNLDVYTKLGLAKVDQIKCEKKAFEDAINDMARHEKYTVTRNVVVQIREDPEKGFITFCTTCQVMCHEDCIYENNDDKIKCYVMDEKHFCTVCRGKCFWTAHKNFIPSVYKSITITETETLEEIKAKYEEAVKRKLTKKQTIKIMKHDLEKLVEAIEGMIRESQRCLKRLSEIALRPDPLTMTDHIQLMIEGEKKGGKPGWENRIKVLEGIADLAELQQQVAESKGDAIREFLKVYESIV
ncbi:uncharacterized protein LOC128236682 [Mya arenaria]|uniref:uncharacterized protein LOC128236682 n=1 Tax=Mya arenaria TaxID=6604 RepID=UPI0022E1CE46|nr:uncharacterized protein LOC128236682 [Mya arenaria]XP_052807679.1 uncharacterized protein LOC128236682 [Mya arenaria]XP_052807680.1 uncharacterized protein LOC128236682 [Mya arenaria]XP_052807681.1 uncharacterized protein LOC128236682 [Mya arenaria]